MKNIVKLMFLMVFVGQYSFGVNWQEFVDYTDEIVHHGASHFSQLFKIFKKDKKNEEIKEIVNPENEKTDIKQKSSNINTQSEQNSQFDDSQEGKKSESKKQNDNVLVKCLKSPIFWVLTIVVVGVGYYVLFGGVEGIANEWDAKNKFGPRNATKGKDGLWYPRDVKKIKNNK